MPVFRFDHLVHADNNGYHKSSDVSPGKTEVEQGKSVEFISTAKGYFRVTCKSQNLNTASTTLSSPWVSYRSKIKAYQLVFSAKFNKK